MKVRELKGSLEQQVDKVKLNPMMTSISHWVRRIFDSPKGQLTTYNFGDIDTLEKLAEIGLVSLKKGGGDNVIAELTEGGRELYRDFTALGYYL